MPDRCWHCGGTGLVLATYTGEPDDCRHCDGGWVRKRDRRGRFVREQRLLWPAGRGEDDDGEETTDD